MVCDLSIVCMASAWFRAAFHLDNAEPLADYMQVPEGLDIENIRTSASDQSATFQVLSTNLLQWFPEETYLHTTAKNCSNRLQRVSEEMSAFVGVLIAWQQAGAALKGLQQALDEPYTTDKLFSRTLQELCNSKEDEYNAHCQALKNLYPWAVEAIWYPRNLHAPWDSSDEDELPQLEL